MTGTQEMVKDIITGLTPVVGPILNLVAANAMRAAQQGQQQPPFLPQNPNAPPLQPASTMVPQQQPVQSHPPQQATATRPPQPGPQAVPNKPNVRDFARAVTLHLKEEMDGFQLGDWFLQEYGVEEFTQLRSEGKTSLLRGLESEPEVWKQLAEYRDDGSLDQMLINFIAWEAPEQEETEEPEDEKDSGGDQPIEAEPIRAGWTAEVKP